METRGGRAGVLLYDPDGTNLLLSLKLEDKDISLCKCLSRQGNYWLEMAKRLLKCKKAVCSAKRL